MKSKQTISLALASMMAAGLLAGCGSTASSTASSAAESTAASSEAASSEAAAPADTTAAGKVYYLNFKPEQDEAWQALAKTYTEETGVPVTVVTAASGQYETTLMSEMAKSDAPTLFQVNGPVGLEQGGRIALGHFAHQSGFVLAEAAVTTVTGTPVSSV